jgi:hypothetical protein
MGGGSASVWPNRWINAQPGNNIGQDILSGPAKVWKIGRMADPWTHEWVDEWTADVSGQDFQNSTHLDMNNSASWDSVLEQWVGLPFPGPELSTFGSTALRGLRLVEYLFANLPTSPIGGQLYHIKDGRDEALGQIISAGGGANKKLVWHNGVNWIVAAGGNVGGGAGGNLSTGSATEPSSPSPGDIWTTPDGDLFIRTASSEWAKISIGSPTPP